MNRKKLNINILKVDEQKSQTENGATKKSLGFRGT